MKKYTKPMVKLVNMKSSEDIALTYKSLQGSFINEYLKTNPNQYAITQYVLAASKVVNN